MRCGRHAHETLDFNTIDDHFIRYQRPGLKTTPCANFTFFIIYTILSVVCFFVFFVFFVCSLIFIIIKKSQVYTYSYKSIYLWTREAGLHQEGPFGPKFIAKAQHLRAQKMEWVSGHSTRPWRRSHLPLILYSPQPNAAMALNLTNSFLQLQRPISPAVAPPKNKVLSPFSSLLNFPRRWLFISVSPNFGVTSRNLEREVTDRL